MCYPYTWHNTEFSRAPFLDVAKVVATQVLTLYEKASIPAAGQKTITDRIVSFHKEHQNLLKSYQNKSRTDSIGLKGAVNKFIKKSNVFFDEAFCKCPIDPANPDESICHCPDKSMKVPAIEKFFLLDQRTSRRMVIGQVDKKVTAVLIKRESRKSAALQPKSADFDAAGPSTAPEIQIENATDSGSEEDFTMKIKGNNPGTSQNRSALLNTALVR